ncbi:MAG: ABC transporter permease [bacterium]
MSWITRLVNTINSRKLDDDLAEEMRDHIARRAADFERDGMSPADARRRAAMAFGNVTRIRSQSRDVMLWPDVESTLQDTRYAWRGLLRNPAFTVTAVVCLGLAIGANTAIYSIVDAVMLRALPLPQPDELFTLTSTDVNHVGVPASDQNDVFSFPLYEELNAAANGSARIALFDSPNRVEIGVAGVDAPMDNAARQFVSVDAFDILGVTPAIGSLFNRTDDRLPSPRAVAVLSHAYWAHHFGGDSSILGTNLLVDGRTYSVLGVAREGFSGIESGRVVDVFLPITLTDPSVFTQREFKAFHLLGRLSGGATREQLEARLQPTFHQHQQARVNDGVSVSDAMRRQLLATTIRVQSGANGVSAFRNTFARPLWILFGVAACVLLIACANVASLLLARSTARSAEMALRVSLGASRVRLVRQVMTECVLISLMATASGWTLARVFAPALVALTSRQADPVQIDLQPDARIFLFSAGVCALSALLFGLLPAWQATSARPMSDLRQVVGHASRLRLGRLFVGVQVAFAFCLVAGGAGFLLSIRNLAAVDTGFDPNDMTVLSVINGLGPQQRALQLTLTRQLQSRVSVLPHVNGAAVAWMPMFSGGRRAERIVLPGKRPSSSEETFYRVSPGFLATLRTPLLDGRDFTLDDNDDEPVPTIVNRTFAKRYFDGESPIGKEFRRTDGTRHQIIGVAASSHFGDLRNGPEAIAYMPMKPPRSFTMYVRSTLDAVSITAMVDREARALGSGMHVTRMSTLETLIDSTIMKERLLAAIGGLFALLGLVLAAIGLFGLLSYTVARRTRELGIRAALGAKRWTLIELVMTDVFGVVATGLVVGLAGSFVLMRIAQSLLFGIQPADPTVIGVAITTFMLAAAVASGVPALRAASIDPMIALRHD